MARGKLLLMRAPSGSGKSTWIQTHVPDALVCSADHAMIDSRTGVYQFSPTKLGYAHKSCFDKCATGMRDGVPVIVVDNTNIVRKHYANYVKLAQEQGYEVFQVCLKTRFTNVHNVPEEKVQQMHDTFEVDSTLPHWQV